MADSVIVLTAPGTAGIAVIRMRGAGVAGFLGRHFTAVVRDAAAVHGRLMDGEREIDDCLITWDAGTQTADIGVHGGTWVVHEVLELARRERFEVGTSSGHSRLREQDAACAAAAEGLRPRTGRRTAGEDASATADAKALEISQGPLPEIAVDARDEIEREILQWLPAARTREAIATLLNQQEAWPRAGFAVSDLRSQMLSDRSLHWLLNPPRIAIIGVPNAGKSTLANRLFGQQRSIVADLPGTTRDYVEDFANLGGLPVLLVDTPGLRTTADRIESAAIGISQGQIASADLRILLLDPTQPGEPQKLLIEQYPDAMVVVGKADLVGERSSQGAGKLLEPVRSWKAPSTRQAVPLAVSATTGEGIGEVELAIRRHFDCEALPHHRPCIWTERQRRLVEAM